MGASLPQISGKDLIRLLKKDGWIEGEYRTHGVALWKRFPDGKRVTIIPTKSRSLPSGTLAAILSDRQTGLGRQGLERLLKS